MSEQGSAPAPSTPSAPAQSGGDDRSPITSNNGNPPQKPNSNAVPPAAPEVFEVKINGKVQRMTREEVLNHASMSHAAQSKFEEAAKSRKQVEKIIHTAKSNPIEALMDPALGLTKDQIRDAFEKWYTQEYIEPETLTPEQRKYKEVEAKLKKFEEQEALKKRQEEDEQRNQLTTREREHLQTQIMDAMEQSGLPKTKFFASRMAFYMRQNLLQGWEAPLSMVVQQVKKEHQAITGNITADSSVEQLISMFGEEVINKIRKHDLEQLRARRENRAPGGANPLSGSAQSNERPSMAEVNRRLREMRNGKR